MTKVGTSSGAVAQLPGQVLRATGFGFDRSTELTPLEARHGAPAAKDPDYVSPYESWFRFSFGPLLPETFESDVAILRQVLDEYRADVRAGR